MVLKVFSLWFLRFFRFAGHKISSQAEGRKREEGNLSPGWGRVPGSERKNSRFPLLNIHQKVVFFMRISLHRYSEKAANIHQKCIKKGGK